VYDDWILGEHGEVVVEDLDSLSTEELDIETDGIGVLWRDGDEMEEERIGIRRV